MKKRVLFIIPDILLVIFLLIILFIPREDILITNNSAVYLFQGAKVANGYSPEIIKNNMVARGPIFVYMLSLFFLLSPPSVASITKIIFLMKLIHAGTLTGIYFLGKNIYSKWAGLISAIFFGTSVEIYRVGMQIDTDIVLCFFLIFFLVFLYKTITRREIIWSILTGLFLGLAYLTKETTMFLVFLLVILGVFYYFNNKKILYYILIILATTFITIIPWAIYVGIKTKSLWPLLGVFNPQFLRTLGYSSGVNLITQFFKNILNFPYNFYKIYVKELSHSFIHPLMIFSSLYVIVKAYLKRNIKYGILILIAFCYLPVVFSALSMGDSIRQGLIIYVVFFTAVSILLLDISKIVNKSGIRNIQTLAKVVTPLLVIFIVIFHVKGNDFYDHYLTKLGAKPSLPEVKSRFTKKQEEGTVFLKNEIAKGSKVFSDGYLIEILPFFMGFEYKFHPTFQHTTLKKDNGSSKSKILFLFTYKKFRYRELRRYRMIIIIDEDMIISELHPGAYITFCARTHYLEEYFNKQKWAKAIFKNGDIFIYKITGEITPISQPFLCINNNFFDDVKWLKEKFPGEFNSSVSQLNSLGISMKQLNKVKCEIFPPIF